MNLFALVGPADEILRYATDDEIDPATGTKPAYRWLPVVDTKPDFAPSSQVREGPTITVEAGAVSRRWVVREKTQSELSADEEARVDEQIATVPSAVARALYDLDGRTRKLEGRPQTTFEQFIADLRSLV